LGKNDVIQYGFKIRTQGLKIQTWSADRFMMHAKRENALPATRKQKRNLAGMNGCTRVTFSAEPV